MVWGLFNQEIHNSTNLVASCYWEVEEVIQELVVGYLLSKCSFAMSHDSKMLVEASKCSDALWFEAAEYALVLQG